jgi:endonuclease YncB( thermonuclease family)
MRNFMRRTVLALTINLMFAISVNAQTISGHVVGVSDGDTIKVLTGNHELTVVRLEGIDCPEKKQAFGKRAKEFTSSLVFDRDVMLDSRGHDRYGRTIAEVRLSDGTSVNYALVKNGLAWWYQKYSKDAKLAGLEQGARRQHLGLWSDASPEAPWDFRHHRRAVSSGNRYENTPYTVYSRIGHGTDQTLHD